MDWMSYEQFAAKGGSDIYDEELLMKFVEGGLISDSEAGFMLGYMAESC